MKSEDLHPIRSTPAVATKAACVVTETTSIEVQTLRVKAPPEPPPAATLKRGEQTPRATSTVPAPATETGIKTEMTTIVPNPAETFEQ
jgi:hypothetical protein